MKRMNLYSNNPVTQKGKRFLSAVLICLPCFLWGQQKLTLNDAINEGLQKNFSINVARNESEMAQRNANPGNAGFLPSVTAYGSVDKAILNTSVKVVTGNEIDLSGAEATITTAGVRAAWTVFEGMGRNSAFDILKELWKISDLETRITMEEVVSGIIKAYCGIIREKQLTDACREMLNVSNFRYFLATERYEAGLASEIEWLQSQVLNHADSIALTLQDAAWQKSRISLNQLLAAEIQRDFATEDSILLGSLPSLNDLIAGGLEANSSYKLAAGELNLSKLEIKSLKAGQYPKISLTGSYGYYENETEASFIKYNRNFGPQFGVNAGISLYDGSKLRHNLENARVKVKNREIIIQEMQLDLTALITETWLDYESHKKSILLGRQGYKLALKNLEVAKEAWQAGLISSLHLREAQENLFQAASGLVNAVYEAKVTETDLLRLSGMLIR